MFDMGPRKRAVIGPLLTFVLIVLAEIVSHGLGQELVAVTLFLLALAPIAYAGLRAGFRNALLCTGMLAAYTLHYTAPHADVLRLDGQGWASFAIILILGVGMAWPMDRVRRREARLRDEIVARTRELEGRNRELTSANAALEAFGYVVSHDLKEPVRALENYLDAALEGFPGPESRMYLEEAHDANRRLTRLLHGLLSYSRTSSLPASTENVDLRGLVLGEGCSTQYAPVLAERSATLEVEGDLPVVMGDRVILGQLFGNLILNAARHHPRTGGRIRVRSLAAEPARAHLVVEDDGAGFPPEVLHRFGLLANGQPATIKAGFGLVIAQRAADRLGGRLWLENAPGGGAAAHVELPAATGKDGVSEVRKVRTSLPRPNDPSERLVER